MTAATQTQGSAVSRAPKKPAPSAFTVIGLAAVVLITLWAGGGIDFTLAPLIYDLTRGEEVLRQFVPNWSFLTRDAVITASLTTLYMAIISATIGCAVAMVVALLASKVSAPNAAVYQVAKAVMSAVRSLPDVAYGLLFVAFVGTGALGGMAALIMFNIGVAAKLTAESIDAVDPGPIEAVEAAGGNRIQRAFTAIIPQVAPNYFSYCFYVFELNLRASLVIGVVGGGGIGQTIMTELARFNYDNISAVIVLFIVVVFVLDRVSRAIRRRLT